jgi:iron complex transport system ATP-binding protein
VPLFSVKNLSVVRNQRMLLDSISFDVRQGEYTAVIGPNGAGKSTLLKCLANLRSDWKGSVLFASKALQSYAPAALARRIAFVQQSLSVEFAFTVRQLVEMGRYPYLKALSPLSETDKEIAEDAMRTMDVLHLADRTMDTLSGGERQKVHIATALTQQAEILFLDEPTAYLDYRYQSEIGRLLRSLNQNEGKTVIEVTHDVNRAVTDATHVIALGSGKIVFDGSPAYLMQPDKLEQVFGISFQFADHPVLPLKIAVPGI